MRPEDSHLKLEAQKGAQKGNQKLDNDEQKPENGDQMLENEGQKPENGDQMSKNSARKAGTGNRGPRDCAEIGGPGDGVAKYVIRCMKNLRFLDPKIFSFH